MLELKALTKEYRSKSGNSIEALKNVTLELPEKGLIFIVGKSGCGKTTLLNMIGAVDTPTSGTLSIYGRETDLNNPTLADAYRSKYIGFVFQEYNLLENDTVTENIRLAGVLSHEILDVSSALEDVGLAEYADRYANELSGGQKQRVAVARALAKNSAVILADEPTGNLDSATGKEIFELLKKVSEKRLVVVVTHDREAANKYGERVIELSDGEIVSDSAPYTGQAMTEAKEEIAVKRLPSREIVKRGVKNLAYQKGRSIAALILLFLSMTVLLWSQLFARFDSSYVLADTYQKSGAEHIILIQTRKGILPPTSNNRRLRLAEKTVDEIGARKIFSSNLGAVVFVGQKSEVTDMGYEFYDGAVELIEDNDCYVTDLNLHYLLELEEIAENYSQYIGVQIPNGNCAGLKIAGVVKTDFLNYYEYVYVQLPNPHIEPYYYLALKEDLTELEKEKAEACSYATMFISKKGAVKYEKRFLVNEYQDATHEEEDLQVNHPLEFEITHNSSVKDLQYFFIYDEAVENCVTANGTETYQPKGREVVFSADLYRKYFEPDYVNNTRPEYIGETFTMSLREQGESEALVVLDDMILAGVYYEPIFYDAEGNNDRPGIYMSKDETTDFYACGFGFGEKGALLKTEPSVNYRTLFRKLRKDGVLPLSGFSIKVYEQEPIFLQFAIIFALLAAVLLVITILMIINVISYSILNQKREIGILRAMGIQAGDVVKIYLIKILILALITLVLATALIFGAVAVTNQLMCDITLEGILWLRYDVWTFLFSLIACIGIPVLAALIPLRKIIKMKPVDAIKG